jgi:mitochondrial fission protein ELM1
MPNCLTPLPPLMPGSDLDAAPVIWLLQGPRLGDNEQVLALGAALEARFGWPARVKQMRYLGSAPARIPLAQSVDHVDLAASDPIVGPAAGPLPDLVISIGRRAAPVARWLKTQHPRTGIHVQLGRYQDDFRDVDLLVTTAQYGLPQALNVLNLTLPITARPAEKLAEAAAHFAAEFDALPRPLIGVLVGGPSRPIEFELAEGERLLQQARDYAQSRQGTLVVATSPRTPAAVGEYLQQNLPAPHRFYPFTAKRAGPNPYLALLALCDSFVVTTDSISMMADACLTGRETRLFSLPVTSRRTLWRPSRPAIWAGRRRIHRLNAGQPADFVDRWYDARVRAGLAQPSRHVPILTNKLLREGQVALLSDAIPPGTGLASLAAHERDMVLVRIEALLAERRASALAARLGDNARRRANHPAGEYTPDLVATEV